MAESHYAQCESLKNTKSEVENFRNFAKSDLDNDTKNTKLPEYFFHYTNPPALAGIIDSNALRMTEISQKRDPFEIKWGMQIVGEILLTEAEKYRNPVFKFFAKNAKKFSESVHDIAHYFLFCVSQVQDDPYQWAEFSEGGRGCCLQFDSFSIQHGFNGDPGCPVENFKGGRSNGSTFLIKVLYDEKKFKKQIKKLVRVCFKNMNLALKKSNGDKVEWWTFFQCMTIEFWSACIGYCIGYKPKQFSNENEFRLLRIVPQDRTPFGLQTEGATSFVTEPNLQKYLRAIWVGPFVPDEAISNLENRLTTTTLLRNVVVRSSKIPFG